MVKVDGGLYLPMFAGKVRKRERVNTFWIDQTAVTHQQFLAFVRANPRWRRSRISRLFAGPSYLQHWKNDLSLGPKANQLQNSPVTYVSWFPARYYCKWKGKRLPRTHEWEYMAMASQTRKQGQKEPGYLQRILAWYSKPTSHILPPVKSTYRNVWGIYDTHGLIWEWTLDFNNITLTGDARSDKALSRKLFCGAGSQGASNVNDYASFMRFAFRSSLQFHFTVANLGFRCASSSLPTNHGKKEPLGKKE
ncbi:MAG: formylglycine-generating enzyme family protein [Deltaproteobacteria bacterium]|nr:MAG: formylglycine-generating enzyme family protein [Deltaproteobacteria bacterium]